MLKSLTHLIVITIVNVKIYSQVPIQIFEFSENETKIATILSIEKIGITQELYDIKYNRLDRERQKLQEIRHSLDKTRQSLKNALRNGKNLNANYKNRISDNLKTCTEGLHRIDKEIQYINCKIKNLHDTNMHVIMLWDGYHETQYYVYYIGNWADLLKINMVYRVSVQLHNNTWDDLIKHNGNWKSWRELVDFNRKLHIPVGYSQHTNSKYLYKLVQKPLNDNFDNIKDQIECINKTELELTIIDDYPIAKLEDSRDYLSISAISLDLYAQNDNDQEKFKINREPLILYSLPNMDSTVLKYKIDHNIGNCNNCKFVVEILSVDVWQLENLK